MLCTYRVEAIGSLLIENFINLLIYEQYKNALQRQLQRDLRLHYISY